MDPISLLVRDPKGSGGGKGFKTGGSYGGGGGGSGGHLPLWAELVIIFSVLWIVLYVSLFIFFLRRAQKDNSRTNSVGHAAWRAFKWATLLGVAIWAIQKIVDRVKASREGKKRVGGTFYRKVEEEERGVKHGSESAETIWPHGPPAPPPSYSPLGGS